MFQGYAVFGAIVLYCATAIFCLSLVFSRKKARSWPPIPKLFKNKGIKLNVTPTPCESPFPPTPTQEAADE